ncbi:ANPRA-like protein [Mya arenaria]|uniref:guanylate cyclase n=1 Tax=Mya arenaria TaxID=6604 RepID=A0ABY7GEI4_MYAAR|nr:ANPRA-like protein [Mya arenaria]
MAVAWNIPHLTYVGTDESLGDKTEFSMLSRLSFTVNMFAKFYVNVFDAFGWTDIANIYDRDVYFPNLVGTSLQRSFDELAQHIRSAPLPFHGKTSDLTAEIQRLMKKAATLSRVSCHGDVLRKIVLLTKAMASLPFGEYVFIFFLSRDGDPSSGTADWFRGDSLDKEARLAYESVMVIRPRRPVSDEFLRFEKEVKERAKTEAGVISGIGGPVFVNENGDRDTDFTLLDLDPITGKFRTVAQYLGWTKTFELITDVPVHWPRRNTAPPNKPECGFMGELCVRFNLESSAIVGISMSAAILLVIAVGCFIYRHMKAEADIHSQWWRVKAEDISLTMASSFFSSRNRYAILQLDDDKSLSLATYGACLQTVGIYKGTQVHIRKPHIKSLPVNRTLLLELKKDILHNESIKLDWDFKLSLLNDIVEGMYYLHSSSINVHGRLTSSRCVIDGRFVLKITGFGLNIMNNTNTRKEHQDNVNVSLPEMLWMAPEHLRNYPPRQKSQTGDVYSFAIILYEICTRAEPYVSEIWYTSLDDTLANIKGVGTSIIRPTLREEDYFPEVVALAKRCWHEVPPERPLFPYIRLIVKRIRLKSTTKFYRDVKPSQNVLDVLLKRMEQYANNLEGLVEERTQALLEEKKKSEELLYQVLPRSVANQLRIGNPVCPESYESVTIYFSDIVVDLLNDLYSCFDSIIEHYDVYKVETIGDAYMVVSGLPERNGVEHVGQIARLALSILDSLQTFVPYVRVWLVVRCLDTACLETLSTLPVEWSPTVNIHISEATTRLLTTFNTFVIEERGEIDIKLAAYLPERKAELLNMSAVTHCPLQAETTSPLHHTENYVYNTADSLGRGATASVFLARSRIETGQEVLILEYCQGGSVKSLLEHPANSLGFEEDEFLNFLRDITEGLRYLKSLKIIHRDIKPGNILRKIESDGSSTYVLTDFGTGRAMQEEEETFMSVYGTEEYIAR